MRRGSLVLEADTADYFNTCWKSERATESNRDKALALREAELSVLGVRFALFGRESGFIEGVRAVFISDALVSESDSLRG